ncbi:MAG: type I restriction endonuclease subunit R [Oscillospiraceae bacterium]|nr:type I restriction endonuclease subunit R [Oscillospiraceae bacterium]
MTINNPNSYLEKEFQAQATDVLQKLGYTVLSPEECYQQRGGRYHVLLGDILRAKLRELNMFEYGGTKYRFKPANIERAIDELNISIDDAGGLIKASEKIYDALLLGRDLPETVADGRSLSFNLRFIDWDNIENNAFHVTQEFSVSNAAGDGGAIPDLVLFVNGIPLGVIECKSPMLDENLAVAQHIRNHGAEYIPQLFKFAQILLASNKNAVRFATAGTPKKFWNIWREEYTDWQNEKLALCVVDRIPTEQDKSLVSLLSKERLLRLTRYFTLYDANVKKIARYQQFFAVEEIIKTVNSTDPVTGNRQSGVIWHTQGSGKSLTMVMLAKYLLEQIRGSKVVIVTDRTELDRQIEKTFSHTKLKPARATSGKNLIDLINEGKSDIVTTIINKFNTVENSKVKIESRDIFVLVDESHRTNYGSLAAKMRFVFPNGCYIGFTGTPLMKNEKTAARFGGNYIHKYTIKDGVDDNAIVPLIYEGRFVEQKVDEANIDLWFDQITRRLSEKQIEDLKSRWSQLRRLTSTDARIRRIALDINTHFLNSFKNTDFKAMLACNYKRDAVRYLECFEQLGDLTTAVVISPPDMREGYEDMDEDPDDKVLAYWKKMMNRYGNFEVYEEITKNRFLDGDIDILIVCGKLLTGFDAPRTQVIYIDKELKEHGLLQAIARANRLYGGKDYGLIVDYRGLIFKLDEAMEIYSGAGLENFDSGEIKGAVVDVISCVGKIRETYSSLLDIFDGLRNSKDTEALEVHLADDKIREDFYAALCEFGKALALALGSEKVYESLPKDEIQRYKQAFAFFSKVRRSVKIRYADSIDNTEYEPQMQNLLDTHLAVAGLKQITNPVDVLNQDELEKEIAQLGSARARADAISSTMTKSISEHFDENPAFYDSFSKRIKEVLEEYKDRVISEAEYLNKMKDILEDYRKGQTNIVFPEKIKGNVHAQAFYGVIGSALDGVVNEPGIEYLTEISLATTEIIQQHNSVDWQTNTDIHKRIAQDIDDLFYEYEKKGLKVDFDTVDKIIENVKTVALRRFR